MAIINLKDWYQIDYALLDVAGVKAILSRIDTVMNDLKSKDLITDWFFLYEGETIRVRMASKNREDLQKNLEELSASNELVPSERLRFSEYQEDDRVMFNETFVESFARMMSEITKLTMAKLKSDINFDNYRILERLQHCMFNNIATLSFKPEEHFLQQRFLERIGRPFDHDFENRL